MSPTWMTKSIASRAQEYGRALLRTKRLRRMTTIIAEFERFVAVEQRQALHDSHIAYEPVQSVMDTRLTLKEAIAFHHLTLAQIAMRAHIPAFYLEQLATCQEGIPDYDIRDVRRSIATALDMPPDAIRWPVLLAREAA